MRFQNRKLTGGRWGMSLLGLISAILFPQFGVAADPPAAGSDRFMRVRRADGVIESLETAIVRYAKPTSESESPALTEPAVMVDLIGVVHVGEREYYEELNRRFRTYDAVLYELVASSGNAVPTPGRGARNPVTAMQVGMKNLLGLHFQLDCIDYRQPNLVHADLSFRELAESRAERGESLAQDLFRMIGQSVALQSKDPSQSSDLRLLAALFARDRDVQLKRIMAEQIVEYSTVTSLLDGPEGSTLITVRNRRALDVLDEQIRAGKKRVAVFYGAAHLPDLERQLRQRFGLIPGETSWLTAWKIGS